MLDTAPTLTGPHVYQYLLVPDLPTLPLPDVRMPTDFCLLAPSEVFFLQELSFLGMISSWRFLAISF